MSGRFAIQTWLMWAFAASFVALAGRNPFLIALVLLVALAVREVCPVRTAQMAGWNALLRLTLVLAFFTVAFNLLTARTGDVVLLTIPDSVPMIDGPFTLNAIVFGLVSAAAIVVLVLVWAIAGSQVSWAELVRILPDRLTGAAVAGAAAINLIPQTTAAIGDMREACAGRGMTTTSPKSLAFLISPIIATGLDRSVQLSEVLEARGFGSAPATVARGRQAQWVIGWSVLMSGLLVGVYAVLARISWAAIGGFAAAGIGFGLVWMLREPVAVRRTRYRDVPLQLRDWIVMTAAVLAVGAIVVVGAAVPEAVNWSPYPVLRAPAFSLWLLVPIGLLLAPVAIVLMQERADD